MKLQTAIVLSAIILSLALITCSVIDHYTFKEPAEIMYADDGMMI